MQISLRPDKTQRFFPFYASHNMMNKRKKDFYTSSSKKSDFFHLSRMVVGLLSTTGNSVHLTHIFLND